MLIEDHIGMLKMSVPSLCYTLQNYMLFVGISNLDVTTFQVGDLIAIMIIVIIIMIIIIIIITIIILIIHIGIYILKYLFRQIDMCINDFLCALRPS